jgi:hypothetical protein
MNGGIIQTIPALDLANRKRRLGDRITAVLASPFLGPAKKERYGQIPRFLF